MRITKYIEEKLRNLENLGIDNPLQEIRYIIREKLNISLEEQIFNKGLKIKNKQIFELEKIFQERQKRKPLSQILENLKISTKIKLTVDVDPINFT